MDQFQKDLQYVRAAVEKHEATSFAPGIPVIWAFICVCGLTLQDIRPQAVSVYWMCAVPVGFVLSMVLGNMHGKGRAAVAPKLGAIEILHWLSIPVAIGLMVYIFSMRSAPTVMGAQMSLLIVALVYFLGGLHLNRVWLYGGLAMAAGILLIPFIPGFPFTATGIAFGAALLFGAFAKRPVPSYRDAASV